MPANENSLVNPSVKELVAIGAAIACNCEMCFKFHFDKARKLGISRSTLWRKIREYGLNRKES